MLNLSLYCSLIQYVSAVYNIKSYTRCKKCFLIFVKISDWQFPYKESHHPVCVHGERKHASVKLRHCDPGVVPGTEDYHYVEAANCRCQVCSSEDTSCEWLPPDSSLLGGLILKEEIEEEFSE
ncbi:unnamed protein product [Diatraea saccharalis]|uniref:Uncharacterized protein n=1 Tax=Diatraea saccharalis TaxID=40085 RepID=A0A9N9WAK1_9NEOP|nr:unnamed protein product [Diatraea saccharalis]